MSKSTIENNTNKEKIIDINLNKINNTNPYGICLIRSIYLRLIGLTYLMAFLSIYFQIQGLYGDEGIFPANHLYKKLIDPNSNFKFVDYPVLIYFSNHFQAFFNYFPVLKNFSNVENFLHLLCLFCIMISILIVLNNRLVYNPLGFFILWLSYLTFLLIGQTFMSFQWDIFLIEVGFITIFFCPLTKSYSKEINSINDLSYMLIRFLMFRFMFSSGVVKLTSRCPEWQKLTALNWHFESQPLPNILSWYAHNYFPDIVKKGLVLGTFIVQVILDIRYKI